MSGESKPNHLDPFSFSKHGLMGGVIGALFLLVFYLIAVVNKSVQQSNITQTRLIEVVQGFNATVFSMGNSFNDLSRDVQTMASPDRPYRPPPWTQHPAADLIPGPGASIRPSNTDVQPN